MSFLSRVRVVANTVSLGGYSVVLEPANIDKQDTKSQTMSGRFLCVRGLLREEHGDSRRDCFGQASDWLRKNKENWEEYNIVILGTTVGTRTYGNHIIITNRDNTKVIYDNLEKLEKKPNDVYTGWFIPVTDLVKE